MQLYGKSFKIYQAQNFLHFSGTFCIVPYLCPLLHSDHMNIKSYKLVIN